MKIILIILLTLIPTTINWNRVSKWENKTVLTEYLVRQENIYANDCYWPCVRDL
jgi:hypothetical protein